MISSKAKQITQNNFFRYNNSLQHTQEHEEERHNYKILYDN